MGSCSLVPEKFQIVIVRGLLVSVFLLAGCQTATPVPAPIPVSEPTLASQPTATIPPVQEAIRQIWAASPHGDTYALEKGPNTYCAKCHAPANWDINSKIDDPPNCVSCKFQNEPEPRVAENNTLVPQDKWQDIACEVCHSVEDNVVQAEITWMNRVTGYHESVQDSTELCEKCHLSNGVLAHKRDLSGVHAALTCTECHDPHSTVAKCVDCHTITMEAGGDETASTEQEITQGTVHQGLICEVCHEGGGFAVGPVRDRAGVCENCHTGSEVLRHKQDLSSEHAAMTCLECHDPHSTATSCTDCHEPALITEAEAGNPSQIEEGHSAVHQGVSCEACHDAGGFEVGPVDGTDQWVVLRTTEFFGQYSTKPYQSHSLQREVDCAKCHYSDNLWGLPGLDGDPDELP